MKKILLFILICLMQVSLVNGLSEQVPDLQVSLLEYSPNPIQPGQVMDLYILIDNEGGKTKDTYLEIIEEHPFIIEHSQDLERAKNLGSISARQILQFRIRIAENAKDGTALLRVRYKANSRDIAEVEEIFDINIQTFDARLDITKVEQFPKEMIPGEAGKIIFTLRNNDDQPLENIDVVLDLTNSYNINTNMDNMLSVQAMLNARLEDVNRRIASGLSPLKGATPMMSGKEETEKKEITEFEILAPLGTSNQKTIPIISPKETAQVVFEVMPLPDVTPNIYAVPVYINYNDEDNSPFHVRVDVPITINMDPELFLDLTSTTLRTTDFSGEVVFTVANRGLSELRYVTLELEEHESIEILTAPRSIYIGNLAPGESKEGKFTILAHEKDILLPLSLSYRDSFNKKKEEKKSIPFYIINKNYYRDLPYEMWIVWIILGGVFLVLTIFYVTHLMKTKRE